MGPVIEDGIPVGNWYDKYNTKNPIAKLLLKNFLKSIEKLLRPLKDDITSITEVGCGEGYLTNYLYSLNITTNIKGCDFSSQVIELANKNKRNPQISFYTKNIYEIDQQDNSDLIVCCEVLEHLKYPRQALDKIKLITNKYCLLSVPNEPVWRVLNLCRGQYIANYGNTPGHINHWSGSSFAKLVSGYFDVLALRKPLPWTMIICKKQTPAP